MSAVDITLDDLEPFADIDDAKAAAMLEDALAMAELVAPCITDNGFDHPGAAKALIRGAILRWNDQGSGAVVSSTSGPFTQQVQQQGRKNMFWPSEIEQLQNLCRSGKPGGAFSIDTSPARGLRHLPWCSIMFGGECSCGAVIAGYPIFEGA